jgi:hypothetical protein
MWFVILRRRLAAVASVVLLSALSGCGLAASQPEAATKQATPAWEFVSRPDLTPPVITSTTEAPLSGDDPSGISRYVFLGPKDVGKGGTMQGLEIADAAGNPVWVHDTEVGTFGFRMQRYDGKPVLTYWAGSSTSYGHGDIIVLDDTYTEIARVTTGGDLGPHLADMHEDEITPYGSMLIVSYPTVQTDLSSIGGPVDGWALDGVVQEIDIATGKVLFEWRSLDHVPVDATYQPIAKDEGTRDKPFDYFHLNSVKLDGADHLLVSARHTHGVYRIDRATGEIDWRLGGKRSDFTFGPDAAFQWQHDAQRQDDGTITLFDNERDPTSARGLRLALDTDTMTATVVNQYRPPTSRFSTTQGNVEVMADGTVFVGWGSQPFYSHYGADGMLLSDATFGGGTSYRAYLAPWTGHPRQPPDVVVKDGVAYVSWNGATEVATWQLVTGTDAAHATPVATMPRTGFETTIPLPDLGPYTAVRALDADGDLIGTGVPK